MSRQYVPKPDGFDHLKVFDAFNMAARNPEVDVVSYLDAFSELSRFFDMMGMLFATMASDIRDQVEIMEKILRSEKGSYYQTVRSTMAYEKSEPSLLEPKRKDQSGSRTLLHLNRTLDFFVQFLTTMETVPDEEKLPRICQPAYKATLGKHHSWLLSKAAGAAIATLPTKVGLYEKVSKYPYQQTAENMTRMVKAMTEVFTKTDTLFTENNLQSLPF
ncbi:hypothetical protein RvY_00182 [Ramazzottius varieornatus]|uniref:Glycolipid transfer protein domain-containing protein n=1 Tax=Ramazzottius varieornatus TaxID=947166 RepID=A0A1D1UG05_RAMVA|nr:hypothetical protein RvY_00182 [Ramazzottius varieornatus]